MAWPVAIGWWDWGIDSDVGMSGITLAEEGGAAGMEEGPNDFTMKLLHLAWHPQANVIACAASNSLYLYCAP